MDTILHLQGDLNSKWGPLFLVHPISGLALPYLSLGALSDGCSRPVFGISSPIYTDPMYQYPASLHDLALSYVTLVKKVQPQGPYLLGGWSMGGMIAMSMAAILEKKADMVLHVILLDSINPAKIPPFESGDQEVHVDLTYSRLLTASSALMRPKVQHLGSSSASTEGSLSPAKGKHGTRVTVTEIDPRSTWASTPSLDERESYNLEGMPDANYAEDEYSEVYHYGRRSSGIEMAVLMREHISQGLWLISSNSKSTKIRIAAPVTLFRCSVLEPLPDTISRARRQSIKANFEDAKLGWQNVGRLRVQTLKSSHDRIFDPQYVAEVTQALKVLLQRCA